MGTLSNLLAGLMLGASIAPIYPALASPVPAVSAPAGRTQPISAPANLVEQARLTLDDLKQDRELGSSWGLVKGGFLLGGEAGSGVLLVRTNTGWSNPAFYYLTSASIGLQIGVEVSELVLFIMNDQALDALLSDGLKLGAQAGAAIATLGSLAEAAMTTAGGTDIVAWSSSTGAYAGLALNGSIIRPRKSYNAEFYTGEPTPAAILKDRTVTNPDADKLRQALGSFR